MQIRLLEQFQGQASYTDTAANTDFAVITLAEPVGKMTGWMGLTYSTAADEAVDITTAGEAHAVTSSPLQLVFSTAIQPSHARQPGLHKLMLSYVQGPDERSEAPLLMAAALRAAQASQTTRR
jgi:hypothetical protein